MKYKTEIRQHVNRYVLNALYENGEKGSLAFGYNLKSVQKHADNEKLMDELANNMEKYIE